MLSFPLTKRDLLAMRLAYEWLRRSNSQHRYEGFYGNLGVERATGALNLGGLPCHEITGAFSYNTYTTRVLRVRLALLLRVALRVGRPKYEGGPDYGVLRWAACGHPAEDDEGDPNISGLHKYTNKPADWHCMECPSKAVGIVGCMASSPDPALCTYRYKTLWKDV